MRSSLSPVISRLPPKLWPNTIILLTSAPGFKLPSAFLAERTDSMGQSAEHAPGLTIETLALAAFLPETACGGSVVTQIGDILVSYASVVTPTMHKRDYVI